MKQRFVSLFLLVSLIALMIPALGTNAWAEEGYNAIVLENGDTIYDICQKLGLDYQLAKRTIMILNGWETEAQMARVNVGDTVLMPKSAYYYVDQPEASGVVPDDIAYYVVTYQVQERDTIENIYSSWGLRYEKFVSLIRLLNCVEDLNALEVGRVYYLPTTALYQPAFITVYAHTMQWGENAYTVFQKYGIEYSDFAELLWRFNNGADLTRVQLGDKLYIPQF